MVSVVGWMLVAIGAYVISLNYWALIQNYRKQRRGEHRHHSFIPLLGGFLTASGIYLLIGNRLAFLMVLADPGVSVLAALPIVLLRQLMHRRRT
jgi:hypothetical protein